jgi:hypothetical protein
MNEQDEFIVEVLELMATKFKTGNCTKAQSDAVYRVASEILPIWATTGEIADHFGKSRDAVHSVIKNKLMSKPKRNVTLYNFKEFCKKIPSSWRKPR